MSGDALFTGLTWDHPRGFRALESAAREAPGLVRWARQPLEGFESHPIADLARRFDLVVMDHPHLGEAVQENCFQPIERLFGGAEIAAWEAAAVGPAMRSYRWGDEHLALPLDVAMQVMARDPARVEQAPDTWDAVRRLAAQVPVALSLAGPHAILCFFSLCLSLGEEPGGPELVGEAVGREALAVVAELAGKAPPGSEAMNPIALLEELAAGNSVALVPLVFGYVNYARAANGTRRAVAFSDAPRMDARGRRGSVLGGTGIAVSRRARPDPRLLAHLRWLMSANTQAGFIPEHDGQPSARAAWADEAVNRAWNGFYRETLATAEGAWVRPRFDGFIRFQTEASTLVREALLAGDPPAPTLARLRALWRDTRARARGPLSNEGAVP